MGCIWSDMCWCYVAVWLWWCGIRMQAEACIRVPLELDVVSYKPRPLYSWIKSTQYPLNRLSGPQGLPACYGEENPLQLWASEVWPFQHAWDAHTSGRYIVWRVLGALTALTGPVEREYWVTRQSSPDEVKPGQHSCTGFFTFFWSPKLFCKGK